MCESLSSLGPNQARLSQFPINVSVQLAQEHRLHAAVKRSLGIIEHGRHKPALASAEYKANIPKILGICALPMTEANRQTFEEAVRSGKEISWTWSKTLSLKQGGPATPSIEVRYLDTKARAIPDLQLAITK